MNLCLFLLGQAIFSWPQWSYLISFNQRDYNLSIYSHLILKIICWIHLIIIFKISVLCDYFFRYVPYDDFSKKSINPLLIFNDENDALLWNFKFIYLCIYNHYIYGNFFIYYLFCSVSIMNSIIIYLSIIILIYI